MKFLWQQNSATANAQKYLAHVDSDEVDQSFFRLTGQLCIIVDILGKYNKRHKFEREKLKLVTISTGWLEALKPSTGCLVFASILAKWLDIYTMV
jgi:hypothetical protein